MKNSFKYIFETYKHNAQVPKHTFTTQVERLHFEAGFPIKNVAAITKKTEEEVLNEVKRFMRSKIETLFRRNTLLFTRADDESVYLDTDGDFTYVKFENNEGQIPHGEGKMITQVNIIV